MLKVFLFVFLSLGFQAWAGLPAPEALKISLTLGEANKAVEIPLQDASNSIEVNLTELQAVDPLVLVNVKIEGNKLSASAAYSAPSFAPVALTATEFAADRKVVGEYTVELEVLPILEIRLGEGDVFDAPEKYVLQPHAGGVLLRFINEDPSGTKHRIHGDGVIGHSRLTDVFTKVGDVYEYKVETTKQEKGKYRCHEHYDLVGETVVEFNVTDAEVLTKVQYKK